jgi:hypothetical protein
MVGRQPVLAMTKVECQILICVRVLTTVLFSEKRLRFVAVRQSAGFVN